MKNFIRILPLMLAVFVSQAFAATGQHLQLRETKTKKIYNAKTDASGKFTFDKIEAGTYDLVWVLPDGTSPDNTESASIEIQSFLGRLEHGHRRSWRWRWSRQNCSDFNNEDR